MHRHYRPEKKKKSNAPFIHLKKKKIPTSLSALNRGLTGTVQRSFQEPGIPEKLIRFLKERISTPLNAHPLVHKTGKVRHTDLIAWVWLFQGLELKGLELGAAWRWGLGGVRGPAASVSCR